MKSYLVLTGSLATNLNGMQRKTKYNDDLIFQKNISESVNIIKVKKKYLHID